MSSKRNVTKRNHYNPCFWTALWNPDYYQAFINCTHQSLDPRHQVAFSLNFRSDKVISTNVENLHYDKGLGRAKITFENAKAFYQKFNPNKYNEFCVNSDPSIYPVYIDLEPLLTMLEQLEPYTVVLDVAQQQGLMCPKDKGFLTSFIFLQWLRSHAILNSFIDWSAKNGIPKFAFFVLLKSAIADPNFGISTKIRLDLAHWTLYRTEVDTFPLTDSPVLVRRNSIMMALSPRLMLEISPDEITSEDEWVTRLCISPEKLIEFRRRTIANTFREIIFSDRSVLEKWQNTNEFRQRVAQISKLKDYSRLLESQSKNELSLLEFWRSAAK